MNMCILSKKEIIPLEDDLYFRRQILDDLLELDLPTRHFRELRTSIDVELTSSGSWRHLYVSWLSSFNRTTICRCDFVRQRAAVRSPGRRILTWSFLGLVSLGPNACKISRYTPIGASSLRAWIRSSLLNIEKSEIARNGRYIFCLSGFPFRMEFALRIYENKWHIWICLAFLFPSPFFVHWSKGYSPVRWCEHDWYDVIEWLCPFHMDDSGPSIPWCNYQFQWQLHLETEERTEEDIVI